jgi:hypothetical protein
LDRLWLMLEEWVVRGQRVEEGMVVLLEGVVCGAGTLLWQDVFLLLLYQRAQWSFHVQFEFYGEAW